MTETFPRKLVARILVATAPLWSLPALAAPAPRVPASVIPQVAAAHAARLALTAPTVVRQAIWAGESIPLRDIPEITFNKDEYQPGGKYDREIGGTKPPKLIPHPFVSQDDRADGALQAEKGTPGPSVINPPSLTFAGMYSSLNVPIFGGRVLPPDTIGDVGPTQYVQMVNSNIEVFNKDGSVAKAPSSLGSLWAAIPGSCANTNAGDPIVLYDQFADRWFLSQFCTVADPNSHQLIAVSKTGDATGSYWLYDFPMPNNKFNDYPHFGVWPDAYYMTDNQFNQAGTAYQGAGAFAFERERMLAGDPAARYVYFDQYLVDPNRGGQLPADADGLIPPPAGAPGYFAELFSTMWGDAIDGLRIYEFHVDWTNPLSSTFTERADSPVPVAAYDPRTPSNSRRTIEQPGATSSSYLDVISDRLMHRLGYRNRGNGNESLVVAHTVNVSGVNPTTAPNHEAGTRYYELRRALPSGTWTVPEQATYNPSPGNGSTGPNYWMGSAAMNHQGDIAVGFSVSSNVTLNIFPSVRYAGRLAGDTANGLFQGEQVIVNGTGRQTSTSNRWGDYSALTVDPVDDCRFWYTNEYYTSASQALSSAEWLTQIGTFTVGSCTASPRGTLSVNVKNCTTNLAVANALVSTTGGYARTTDAAGLAAITPIAPGTYTVTITGVGYSPVTVNNVTVTNGTTTTVNVCLNGFPVITQGAGTLSAESCTPPNNTPDPGELVTYNYCVQNVGGLDTVNLVGTLQAAGGVINPGPAQSFGVVPYGGAPVCRAFTFRVDYATACGASITPAIALQDGVTGYGTFTYPASTGTAVVRLAESFDGAAAGAIPPPAGWAASQVTSCGTAPAQWATVTTSADTAPNSAFSVNPTCVTDNRLTSPAISITSASAQVKFRNHYNLESGYDGGVLEVSSPNINAGAFTDVTNAAVGGSFASGAYTGTIPSGYQNPLANRQAWTGDSAGFKDTVANLGPNVAGQTIQLRFRMGSDNTTAATGWWVDTLQVTDGVLCESCNTPPTITPTPAGIPVTTGAPASLVQIATVNDLESPLQSLAVVMTTTLPAGVSVTGISVDASGNVTATVSATCAATPGPFTLGLQVTDQGGMTGTGNLTVNVLSGAPVTTATNNGPICPGDTLQLSVTTVPGATYAWTGPSGFSSTQQNPTIAKATSVNAGVYTVIVTTLCPSAPATTTVAVKNAVSAVVSTPLTICQNATGTASVTTNAVTPKYEWSVTNHTGSGQIEGDASGTSVSYTATGGGSFALTCKITDLSTGCVNYGNVDITVTPAALPAINAPIYVQAGAAGQTASIASPNAGSTYAWTITNGTITAGQGTSSITFTSTAGGSSTLKVVETTAAGCTTQQAQKKVMVYASGAPCTGDANTLCLGQDRFKATVDWKNYNTGATGKGVAVNLTTDSGYFWFLASSNTELFVKVLDGTSVNNAYWVLFGALSDMEYTLRIEDTVTGNVKTYFNPAHTLASLADVTAFPETAASRVDGIATTDAQYGQLAAIQYALTQELERTVAKAARPAAAQSVSAAAAGCTNGPEDLCLRNSRFDVTIQWKNYTTGQEGMGRAVPLSGDSGYFWFFGKDNIEIAAKILDGTGVNGKYWVFYGALTDVEFNMTVTDTQTGTTKTYYNPPNVMKSIADVTAF